jgi:tetratricopeptide (TPR) repeat protein
MLQPVREYAFDQLDIHAEAEQTQRRHARYFMEMIQSAEPAIGGPEQLRWLRRIKQERENLQLALQWMLDRQEIEMAFTLLGGVWRYYNMLNIWDEIKSWMDRALAQGAHPRTVHRDRLKSAARVKTLWGAYWLTARQNDRLKSFALAEEGLRSARELEDLRLIGLLLQCMVSELCYRNRYDEALQAVDESLRIFRELGDQEEIAWALGHRSALFSQRGDLAKGRETLQESLSIFRAIGNDWATEQVLRDLSLLLWRQGDLEQVKAVLEESLMLSEKLGKRMGIGWTLSLQGRLALQQSDFVAARELFEKAQVIFQQIGDQTALVDNLEYLKRLELIEKGVLKD